MGRRIGEKSFDKEILRLRITGAIKNVILDDKLNGGSCNADKVSNEIYIILKINNYLNL